MLLDGSIETALTADLPYLHKYTPGLDKDRAAVDTGPTLPYHNDETEGVNTKL